MLRPVLEHVGPLRALGAAVLRRRQAAKVEIDGLHYSLHPGDFGVTLELHGAGAYEPGSLAAMLAALPEGGCFVDVGAHVGLFTLPAARHVGPGGTVIAFEPDPDNRRLLLANLERNDLADRVHVIPAAVGEHDGTAVLQRSAWNTGDHRLAGAPRGRRGVEVPLKSLHDTLAQRQVQADVIKIDVQGYEPPVMRGLGTPDPLPTVLLEYSPSMVRDAGEDPEAMLAMLAQAGWTMATIDEDSGDVDVVDVEAIIKTCPEQGYVNLLCRPGGGA